VMASRLIKQGRWSLAGEELSMLLSCRRIDLKRAAAVTLFGFFPVLKRVYLTLAGRA